MSVFKFKHFDINQAVSAMKVGSDAMVFGALIAIDDAVELLDIGTGTGVLSLMLAQKNKSVKIDAVEIEEESFLEAKKNISDSPFHQQITVFKVDFLEFKTDKCYDLIFSNPPFFENSFKTKILAKNLARHTDSLPFENLILKAKELLSEKGVFYIILPYNEWLIFLKLAELHKFSLSHYTEIFGKKDKLKRIIAGLSKISKECIRKELIIREENNNYTGEYIELTKEFHYKDVTS